MNSDYICIDNELNLFDQLTFDAFKSTSFYDNQSDNRFFWIKKPCTIDEINNTLKVGLWFKNNKLRQVQLVCIDDYIKNELERGVIHNKIIKQLKDRYAIPKNNIYGFYDNHDCFSYIIINF